MWKCIYFILIFCRSYIQGVRKVLVWVNVRRTGKVNFFLNFKLTCTCTEAWTLWVVNFFPLALGPTHFIILYQVLPMYYESLERRIFLFKLEVSMSNCFRIAKEWRKRFYEIKNRFFRLCKKFTIHLDSCIVNSFEHL